MRDCALCVLGAPNDAAWHDFVDPEGLIVASTSQKKTTTKATAKKSGGSSGSRTAARKKPQPRPIRREVGGALLVTGCLLFASDRVRKGHKNERSARLTDTLLVGAAQALATCPGLSRSGTTITAGCFLGFERKFAVRYSFILSIPAVLGANILSLKDALGGDVVWKDVPVYLAGVLVAAAAGYACIRLLKMIVNKGKFGAFAYYCWAVGLLTIALTFIKG